MLRLYYRCDIIPIAPDETALLREGLFLFIIKKLRGLALLAP